MKSNLKRLQDSMEARSIPAILVSDNSNVQWVSGFSGSWGFVIATPSTALFVTDSRYTEQAREEVKDMTQASYSTPVDSAEFLAEKVAGLGIEKLGFESQKVSYATYTDWCHKFAPIQLDPFTDLIEPLRIVKTDAEVESIRKACAIADRCFDHVIRLIQPGVTEFDISLDIEFYIRRQGAELAFPPIVVSGSRSARPHGHPSEKKLERGDFVTMDFGARLNGYNSDITRTVVVGVAGDRHREIYDSVLDAQMAAIDAIKPGVTAGSIDKLSREVLSRKNLDKYFGHGLGHSLGKDVHDGGRMSSNSTTLLAPGQVWTVEPGVYIEGFGGVRIEDDVVVTEKGAEVLTRSPKELLVLPLA